MFDNAAFFSSMHLPVSVIPPSLLVILLVTIGNEPNGHGAVFQEAAFDDFVHLFDRANGIVQRGIVPAKMSYGKEPKADRWKGVVVEIDVLSFLKLRGIILQGFKRIFRRIPQCRNDLLIDKRIPDRFFSPQDPRQPF